MARTYVPKGPADPRSEAVANWQQNKKLAQAIIQAALKEPDSIKVQILKEVTAMLGHGMRVLPLLEAMQAEAPDQDFHLQIRRAEILKLWRGITKLTKHMINKALEDPLSLKPNALNGINAVSAKALQMVTILEKIQADQIEDQKREEQGGLTDDELNLLRDFDQIMEGGDLKNGSSKEDSWQIA